MKKNKEKRVVKEKSPYRFRALDAVIILLILTAVIGVYFRYNILDQLTNNKDHQDYTVSFSIENVRYTIDEYMKIGDQVYFVDDGELMGALISESKEMSTRALSITPASEFFMDEDGTMKEVLYPNNESRVDAKGRIQCRGLYTEDGGFLLNGSKYLSAGQTVSVRTETVTVDIVIQNIELAQ